MRFRILLRSLVFFLISAVSDLSFGAGGAYDPNFDVAPWARTTLEAEHYDRGGEGSGYHDTTPGNAYGAFRNDDVDIVAGNNGTVYIAETKAGEWLEYSFYVRPQPQPGPYEMAVEVRVASNGPGGTFRILAGGLQQFTSGPVQIPDTGGWQTWTTVRTIVKFPVDNQTMRLVFDSEGPSGYVGNIDSITFVGQAETAVPFLYRVVQIEDYDNGGPLIAYHDTTPGNTYGAYRDDDVDIVAGDNETIYIAETKAGEWLEYTLLNNDTSGNEWFGVELRVASAGNGGTLHIEIDGDDKTGPISIPDSGGWQNWTTVRGRDIRIPTGQHVMRLVLDQDGETGYVGNIDYINLSLAGPRSAFPFRRVAPPNFIRAADYDTGGEGVGYHDMTPGNRYGAYRSDNVDIANGHPIIRFGNNQQGNAESHVFVADTTAGEWLEYSMDPPSPGQYYLSIDLASAGPGGTLHVELDGVDITGPITVPDTGGWQIFQQLDLRDRVFTLAHSPHRLRLSFDSNGPTGYVGNVLGMFLTNAR